MERSKTQNIQHNTEGGECIGRLTLPYFKTPYKLKAIKAVCYWRKNRPIDQWNKRESPKGDLPKYRQQLMQGTKSNTLEQRRLFNKGCWNIWTSTWEKRIQTQALGPSQKINSFELIIDFGVKHKIIKLHGICIWICIPKHGRTSRG